MKLLIVTLGRSMVACLEALMLMSFVFLIFGIGGLQSFSGRIFSAEAWQVVVAREEREQREAPPVRRREKA